MTRSTPLIGIVGGAVLVTAVAALAIRGTGDDVDMPPDPSAQETTEPTDDVTDPDATEPTDDVTDPDATEPADDATDPDATEPTDDATDPDATEPADDATDDPADDADPDEDELPVTGGGGLAVLGTLVAASAAAAGHRTRRA